jgi:PAS domain S-box-containing protein
MFNLGSRKFVVTGAAIFMIDFMIMTILPLEELLMHFTAYNIVFSAALIQTLLCMPLILYANSKHRSPPSGVDADSQDITGQNRIQRALAEIEEKDKRIDALVLASKKLAFQTRIEAHRSEVESVAQDFSQIIDKEKRADALIIANKELVFQNEEKDKRADELVLANKELAFQKDEKNKRADELILANKEKEKKANALIIANEELVFQNEEKEKRANELVLANKEKEKQENALIIAKKELAFQAELRDHRSEVERVARDLALLIDTANAPIFGIDEQGLVNEWNLQAEEITGFTKNEVIGRDLVAYFITDDFKVSVGDVLERALHGEETANYEFPLFTKAGDQVDVLLNSTTRRNASGRIIGVIGVGQDITELKKTQAQVIQSSKLASLGEMATSVAHELNQPLNTIRMAASNITDRIELNTVTTEYLSRKLQRIDEQAVRASKIINHMRMFGRKADEKSINFDPWVAVKSVMDLIGEQLRLESIEVTAICDHECPVIFGHQIQLEQVFVNIIGNARDAILEHGEKTGQKITITGTPIDDKKFEISITDTGIGIPKGLLPRIFEPFITSKPMGKGTGLGLSVSYGIISDMNGTITAENIEDGSRFNIILPLVLM